jgi:putative transposase
MRKSRFSEEQLVAILRGADSTSVAATAKKDKVSEQAISAWRRYFGKLAPSDFKRLRTWQAETACPKRLLAERPPVQHLHGLLCSPM